MLCSFNVCVLSATKQQEVFVAYLSQCFADNSHVIVQLSVSLIHEFLSAQVYVLFIKKLILYIMYSQLLWHNGTVFT